MVPETVTSAHARVPLKYVVTSAVLPLDSIWLLTVPSNVSAKANGKPTQPKDHSVIIRNRVRMCLLLAVSDRELWLLAGQRCGIFLLQRHVDLVVEGVVAAVVFVSCDARR